MREEDEGEPPGPPLPVRPRIELPQLDHRQVQGDDERQQEDELSGRREVDEDHATIVSERARGRNRLRRTAESIRCPRAT
jgi:hypothetical protein